MSLYEKIITIYPELASSPTEPFKPFGDGYITLQNNSNGKGDYILKWEHPTLARPTAEQLA